MLVDIVLADLLCVYSLGYLDHLPVKDRQSTSL
jgi:hypothetical protein